MTRFATGARRSILRAILDTITATLVTIVTTGIIGCGGGKDATTAPTVTVAGTYVLQKIDQAVLPTEIFNGSATDNTTGKAYDQFIVTVNSGTLELDAQGNYHTMFGYEIVLDGKAENRTLQAQGTYEVNGKQISLTRDNRVDGADGTLESGQVTLELTLMGNTPNKAYVFRK